MTKLCHDFYGLDTKKLEGHPEVMHIKDLEGA